MSQLLQVTGRRRKERPSRTAKEKRPSSKKQKLLDSATIVSVSAKSCCKHGCISAFSFADLQHCREHICSLSEVERTQLILNDMHASYNGTKFEFKIQGSDLPTSIVLMFYYTGKSVCYEAYRQVHGFSRPKVKRAQEIWQSGGRLPLHGNQGLVRHSKKWEQTYQWLNTFINQIGEHVR